MMLVASMMGFGLSPTTSPAVTARCAMSISSDFRMAWPFARTNRAMTPRRSQALVPFRRGDKAFR